MELVSIACVGRVLHCLFIECCNSIAFRSVEESQAVCNNIGGIWAKHVATALAGFTGHLISSQCSNAPRNLVVYERLCHNLAIMGKANSPPHFRVLTGHGLLLCDVERYCSAPLQVTGLCADLQQPSTHAQSSGQTRCLFWVHPAASMFQDACFMSTVLDSICHQYWYILHTRNVTAYWQSKTNA